MKQIGILNRIGLVGAFRHFSTVQTFGPDLDWSRTFPGLLKLVVRRRGAKPVKHRSNMVSLNTASKKTAAYGSFDRSLLSTVTKVCSK